MTQKIAFLFKNQGVALIILFYAIINGFFGKIYADRDRDSDVENLKSVVGTLSTNTTGTYVAIKELQGNDKMHAEEISELQKSILRTNSSLIRMESRLMRLERNQDRIGWVVDELAKKNGITPPKPILEPTE